ncbi:MAG: hypothetical protein J7L14_02325, partial [Candidatus Diapherotrites archaeon]|nr:hypothetical protein [Candidatus Diapherotrites archaeon]
TLFTDIIKPWTSPGVVTMDTITYFTHDVFFQRDVNAEGTVNVKRNVNVERNVNVRGNINVDGNVNVKGQLLCNGQPCVSEVNAPTEVSGLQGDVNSLASVVAIKTKKISSFGEMSAILEAASDALLEGHSVIASFAWPPVTYLLFLVGLGEDTKKSILRVSTNYMFLDGNLFVNPTGAGERANVLVDGDLYVRGGGIILNGKRITGWPLSDYRIVAQYAYSSRHYDPYTRKHIYRYEAICPDGWGVVGGDCLIPVTGSYAFAIRGDLSLLAGQERNRGYYKAYTCYYTEDALKDCNPTTHECKLKTTSGLAGARVLCAKIPTVEEYPQAPKIP